MIVQTEPANADYALACYAHLAHARPFFGVLAPDGDTLAWSAGGADLAGSVPTSRRGMRFTDLLQSLGIGAVDRAEVRQVAATLGPGETVHVARRLAADDGRTYAVAFRRRPGADTPCQLTLWDLSDFVTAEQHTRFLAKAILDGLTATSPGSPSVVAQLDALGAGVRVLPASADDPALGRQAGALAGAVDGIADRCIDILRRFEQDPADDAEPDRIVPSYFMAELSSVTSWEDLRQQVALGRLISSACLALAGDFARHATSLLVVCPDGGEVHVLNGPQGGATAKDIDGLVRLLAVEENSRRTAATFFTALAHRRSSAAFACAGRNIEAQGRPILSGGWQATLHPAATEAVDIRGLFHGLKNLLLHLQVLHVVKTRADLDQVGGGLDDTLRRIDQRLQALRRIAETGRDERSLAVETVGQWLVAARRVAGELRRDIRVVANACIEQMAFRAVPEEMEDTLAEVTRNAFQHGASVVTVEAAMQGHHLTIRVADDGRGIESGKLAQLRTVLQSRRYDPGLSTRPGGTGNGLLSAAKAVGRFIDGHLDVRRGASGRGTEVLIALRAPVPEAM